MFPIRDTVQSQTHPVVNNLIIAANVLVFLMQLSLPGDSRTFVNTYGLIPARYTDPGIGAYFTWGQQVFSFVSFMFLHGGLWHLVGNMWMLYIFGDNVEDRLGHLRYLVFYLICGMTSGLAHMVSIPASTLPTVGASGAIAGVMGAYFLLHPRAKVLTLIPILFIPWFVEIPAFFFLGLWFVMQFLNAAGQASGGVAWWAHVGGFVVGMALVPVFSSIPAMGADRTARQFTARRKTPRLQMVRPSGSAQDPNLYGTLVLTPREAMAGTRKIINIPWGFQRRLFTVMAPPGVKPGTRLRLQGLGRSIPGGGAGDVFLTVVISRENGGLAG